MEKTKAKRNTEDKFQIERKKKSEAYGQVRVVALDLFPKLAEMPDYAQGVLVDRVFGQVLCLDEGGSVDETIEMAGDLREAFIEAGAFAIECFAGFGALGVAEQALVVDKIFDMTMVDDDDELDTEGADKELATLKALLEDAHVIEFAREVYGSKSPLALLAAAEADIAWHDGE